MFYSFTTSSGFLYPTTLPLCLLICLWSCLLLHRQTRLSSLHFQRLFFVAPQLSVAFYWSSLAAPILTKQRIWVRSEYRIIILLLFVVKLVLLSLQYCFLIGCNIVWIKKNFKLPPLSNSHCETCDDMEINKSFWPSEESYRQHICL